MLIPKILQWVCTVFRIYPTGFTFRLCFGLSPRLQISGSIPFPNILHHCPDFCLRAFASAVLPRTDCHPHTTSQHWLLILLNLNTGVDATQFKALPSTGFVTAHS